MSPIRPQQWKRSRKSRKLQRTCSLSRSIMGRLWSLQLVNRPLTFPNTIRLLKENISKQMQMYFDCGVSPNASGAGDSSACPETCRCFSLPEQDGRTVTCCRPAPQRARLRASSQIERKRRNPARTFKIHLPPCLTPFNASARAYIQETYRNTGFYFNRQIPRYYKDVGTEARIGGQALGF